MYRLEATFEVVTPIFSGRSPEDSRRPESDNRPLDALRPTSIKGVLRFWWRALAWRAFSKHLSDASPGGADMRQVMQAIHDAEGWLFGAAGRNVSRIRIRPPRNLEKGYPLGFDSNGTTRCDGGEQDRKNIQMLTYLGYGLGVDREERRHRRPLAVKVFTVDIMVDDRIPSGDLAGQPLQRVALDLLPLAIKAWGLLGGLGAKTRRGFGSLALRLLMKGDQPLFDAREGITLEHYRAALKDVLPGAGAGGVDDRLPYSAFSSRSRVTVCLAHEKPRLVLAEAGYALQHYRVYGNRGRLSVPEQIGPRHRALQAAPDAVKARDQGVWKRTFEGDHDDFYVPKRPRRRPDRAVFGLPHNYPKGDKKAVIGLEADGNKISRRASPLFLHVHRLSGEAPGGKDVYVLVAILLIPGDEWFLPSGASLAWEAFKQKPQKFSGTDGPSVDWSVLTGFLDRFKPLEKEGRSLPRLNAGIQVPVAEKALGGLTLPLEIMG